MVIKKNSAYFERRLPTDIHKKHVMSFQHVLKHLLAGKSPDSRPERKKEHLQTSAHFNIPSSIKHTDYTGNITGVENWFLCMQHHLEETQQLATMDPSQSQAFDQPLCDGSSLISLKEEKSVKPGWQSGLTGALQEQSIELWN